VWIDLSGNGSLVDEATFITAIAGVGFGIVKIWQQTRSNHSKLDELAENLNHIDEEPEVDQPPTLGQRVVRIERQVDAINDSVLDLTGAMTQHILWEEKKANRIDRRLTDVEDALHAVRECMERNHPEAPMLTSPTKRPRKKSNG